METTLTPLAPPPDLSHCDREPIHIPGAIQSYGVLLALSGPRLQIVQTTPTCWPLLRLEESDLLERELGQALGTDLEQSVREALDRHRASPTTPATFVWRVPDGGPQLAGYVHRSGGLAVLELEPLAGDDPQGSEDLAAALTAFNLVRAEPELEAKAQAAAALIQRLTGFDRAMVYRFATDWHGEVIAESCGLVLEPYLGLHYPASDIPVQARRLYLLNPIRVIADIDAIPAPLLPQTDPTIGQPLDLSHSLLRSVSPVHVEYLRNMGVRATLSFALIRDGALWGLVACHHLTPRRLGRGLRELLGWMVQDLATQLALAQEVRARQYAARLKLCRDNVISAMRRGARLSNLIQGAELHDLLGAVGADGVALLRGTDVTTGGVAPPPVRICAIADGLSALYPDDPAGVFLTDCLSQHLPDTEDLAQSAAGLAVFPLTEGPPVKLLWFRGEWLSQVTWAGNPDKAANPTANGRLSPRKSFAAWSQTVELKSLPWTAEQVDSARHLVTLVDIELHKIAEEALRASLAEVRRHDAWMVGLYRMNDLLLSCETRTEAAAVIAQGAAVIFAGHSGALALRQNGIPEFRLVASWGGNSGLPDIVQMRDCWALRRGETYEVADPANAVHCPHVHGGQGRPYLCVPLNVRGETLGLLHLEAGNRSPSSSWGELRTLTETVGESVKLVLSNLRFQAALREQAIRDPLTGLFNRHYLDETLPRELERRELRNEPLAVARLDLDHFKLLNDTCGPEAGDLVLLAIGDLLRQSLTGGDIACRYGGEGLALVIPDAALDEVRTRLDGLRQSIADLRLTHRGIELPPVSISVGIAEARQGETDAQTLLARAEVALHRAKAEGRDRVVVFEGA